MTSDSKVQEDRCDLEAVKKAMEEPGTIAWEQVKRDLDLQS